MVDQQFTSALDLLRDTSEDAQLVNEVAEQVSQRQLIKHLTAHRVRSNLSQKDVADCMNCSQSRVSKLEASKDADLRLGDLEQYLQAMDLQLRLVVAPRSQKAVDEIRFHAYRIRELLFRLVELASTEDAQLADGIARFACLEAPINLLKIILDAANKLPEQVLDRLPTLMIEDTAYVDRDCQESADKDELPATR